jgi:soluble lytic murein transglycosylase-like protein
LRVAVFLWACVWICGSSARAATVDWNLLASQTQEADTQAKAARILQNPAATLTAEQHYAGVLAGLSRRLIESDSDSLPVGPAVPAIIKHLLLARDPAARDWLAQHWRVAGQRIDPHGGLTFWAGLDAFENKRWDAAIACFSARIPPLLRGYADWLLVSALEKVDRHAAGEKALQIALGASQHRFRGLLLLCGARELVRRELYGRADNLLQRWLQRSSPARDLFASGQTLLAEISLRRGREAEFVSRFDAAARTGESSWRVGDLRLGQARYIVKEGKAVPSMRLADCIEIVSRWGSAREGLVVWGQRAVRLTVSDSARVAETLLRGLYRERQGERLLGFARALESCSSRPVRMRAQLVAARTWRGRGRIVQMTRAYRRAAAWSDSTIVLGAVERDIAATALWELGREMEDAQRWSEAAEAFGRLSRRFPAYERTQRAALRAALATHRAGRSVEGLAQLIELCRGAPRDQRAGACLWRALLMDDLERTSFLQAAAGEENPGYFALRASAALAERGSTEGEGAAAGARDASGCDSIFWKDLGRAVRESGNWSWPAAGTAPQGISARRILQIIAGNPSAEAGRLFLAYGHLSWARRLWRSLPGWGALAADERGALLRALGDQGQAVRMAIRSGRRRGGYPVAFTAEVEEAAQRFDVCPAFLLAVARQESLFEPTARSSAGARGLMQLMPATARRMADSLSVPVYDLARPRDNLLLGTRHLVELLEKADGAVPLALAAYNGGLGNARRWYREGMSWDEYVEGIGFAETRRFVKSVLMHYWFYRACYPGEGSAAGSDGGVCTCR